MKRFNHILSILLITVLTCLIINAQDSDIEHPAFSETQFKGINYQPENSISIVLPNHQQTIRAKYYIENSKNNWDGARIIDTQRAVNEAPNDSAYVYLWNGAWDLNYRIYYYFDALSIDILQEEFNPDGTWSNYFKRVLEYYNSGAFRRETESYWKSSVVDWQIGYLEEYNTAGRNIEVYSKNWNDTTQEFTEGFRIISGYKKDTLLETEVYQEWDVDSKGWMNLIKIDNDYKPTDLISNTLESVWKDGDWRNSYSIYYDFNEFGDLITETTQAWDTLLNTWINDVMIERQYNSLGNITNVLRKQWDTNASDWVNEVQQVVNYDDFFQVESNLVQAWNGSLWIDSLRSSYTYTAEGDISQYLEEVWSGSNWDNLYREVYSYDSKTITININNWNSDASSWENDILVINYIHDLGFINIQQYDYWNSISSIYETGYYDEYDEYGHNSEYYEKFWNDSLNKFTGGIRILQTYYGNTRWEKQSIIQVWDTLALEWKNEQKTDYFWSTELSTELVNQSGSHKIYPSPFNSIINIESTEVLESPFTLKIFDLNGRMVSESKIADRITTLDLSHLKKGVYLAEISAPDGRSVIKLIKY